MLNDDIELKIGQHFCDDVFVGEQSDFCGQNMFAGVVGPCFEHKVLIGFTGTVVDVGEETINGIIGARYFDYRTVVELLLVYFDCRLVYYVQCTF